MHSLLTKLSVIAAAAGFASAALAQDPPPQPQAPPPAPQQAPVPAEPEPVEVTDAQLDTFTTIYVEMQELSVEFQEEMAQVESEEEARDVQARMQEASVELIGEHGWSLEEYNETAQAINSQPDVLDRALELIEEKSS